MITAVRRHSGKCALAGAAPVGARGALRTGASVLAWSHLNASLCEVPSGSFCASPWGPTETVSVPTLSHGPPLLANLKIALLPNAGT